MRAAAIEPMPALAADFAHKIPWPLPALLAWAGGWAAAIAAGQFGLAGGWPLALGVACATVLALPNQGHWRRLIAALGFPLSVLLLGGPAFGSSPAAWLLALMPVALLYPMRAWRDAPFFPTPAQALQGLASQVSPLPLRVLDAGCGLGHGLRALRGQWPGAALEGVEWSAPMAWLAARAAPGARVTRGDMWRLSWAPYDVVYLFQRPESMPRAWHKATAEMRPGSWLVSLEFPVPDVPAHASLQAGQGGRGRALHLYRLPAQTSAGRRSKAGAPGR